MPKGREQARRVRQRRIFAGRERERVRERERHTQLTNVGLFESGRIVDAVAGHGRNVARTLELVDDGELVLGRGASKDDFLHVDELCPVVFCHRGDFHGFAANHFRASRDFNPTDHCRTDLRVIFVDTGLVDATLSGERPARWQCDEADVSSDGLGRDGVIAGHHHHFDSSLVALLDSVGHLIPRRISQGDEASKDEVAHSRFLILAHQACLELLQKVAVGLFLVLDRLGHVTKGETEHALSIAAKVIVHNVVVGGESSVHGLDGAVCCEVLVALAQQHVGGPLDEHDLLAAFAGQIMNRHLPLVFRVERHLVDLDVVLAVVLDGLAMRGSDASAKKLVHANFRRVAVGLQLVLLRVSFGRFHLQRDSGVEASNFHQARDLGRQP